jgi:hypothetical protein
MRLNLPTYEDAKHSGNWRCGKTEHEMDWSTGYNPQKYKQTGQFPNWRIYEGDRYRFMSAGYNNPSSRNEFSASTFGTAEIVLRSGAPALYTEDGEKLVKAHTYPMRTAKRGRYSYEVGYWVWDKLVQVTEATTVLLDHQFHTATALAPNSNIYLPYRTAQPIVTGQEYFVTYRVTRALQKEWRERGVYVKERAHAIAAIINDSVQYHTMRLEGGEHIDQIKEGFKAGRFDHWTSAMYIYAALSYAGTQEALYDMTPSERFERLYLEGRWR